MEQNLFSLAGARILKSASITFQNIDGSISEDIIAGDQNVDWHYPLVLSSKMAEATNLKKIFKMH